MREIVEMTWVRGERWRTGACSTGSMANQNLHLGKNRRPLVEYGRRVDKQLNSALRPARVALSIKQGVRDPFRSSAGPGVASSFPTLNAIEASTKDRPRDL
jgi:hypothetical protein